MLLPDMTTQEIRKNLLQDLSEIMIRGQKMNRKLEREILIPNENNEHVPAVRYMTTKNKIKWMVKYSLKPGKKDEVDISLGTFYHSRKGLRYVAFDPHNYSMQIYNSHFYRRYNERMKLNLKDDIRAIHQVYYKRNLDCTMIVEHKKLENGLIEQMTQIPDGLKFGKRNLEARTTVWNTFISNQEYKGNQGIYKDKIVGLLKFAERMGVVHKLDQDDWRMYQLFKNNKEQKEEVPISTDFDLPTSQKNKEKLIKQKEIADKVLLALTNKNGVHPPGKGIFSVK